MIAIDRMETDFRLAGLPAARAHLARRLDRIVREQVAAALDALLREFAADDGPVYRIRRLDLTLWLDAARSNDAEIARSWVGSIARALYREIAEGGPGQVMRYPSHAAFLTAYLSDLAAGRASGRWQYAEFATLSDLPVGQAATFVLGRDPRWIAPVFQLLTAADRLDSVVSQFKRRDVEALWRAWTDAAPLAPSRIDANLLARAAHIVTEPPAVEATGADGRARTALRWLVALTTGRSALPPASAAGLALQLGHLAALLQAVPPLREALRDGRPLDLPLRRAAAAAGLTAASEWLEKAAATPDGEARLRDLARLLDGPAPPQRTARQAAERPERIVSPFAGLALLLPSVRRLELAPRLGPVGLELLLVGAVPERQRPIARGDLGLRWMSGLPRHAPLDGPPIDWPEGPVDPRDPASHGEGPELPAVRRVLDDFASGLRGMKGSSADYLARQFLCRSGTVVRGERTLRVRLSAVPLRILLQIGVRLGSQGTLDWLDGRELVIEITDG